MILIRDVRPLEPGLSLRAYRLQRRLGRGGDGDVWLAVDTQGNEVALKARPREDGAQEQRLRREFERLRTLRLPNVIRVLDVGTDQGYVFFAMEVARGRPFDRYVNEPRELGERVRRLCAAGAGIAHALAGMHRLGLAHRDLKPANVLVAEDGRVTILDFGAMRFGAGQDESGNFAGTIAYMAPEQRVGLPNDERVDRYALGVMLHEALSGAPASSQQPGRPRATLLRLGPQVPLALAHLVDGLCALDPEERPSAEHAERVLDALASGRPLPPTPWPNPLRYAGDASPLLQQSAAVVGSPGSGRRRMVQEARWLWHRRGYRSVAGACSPDRPYGALRALLAALLAARTPEQRRRVAGDEAPLLQAIWPELPVPVWDPLPEAPRPDALAVALSRVLSREAPLAVVLWDLDEADPGTAAVVGHLCGLLPKRVLLWATSRRPWPGLATVAPPSWSPEREIEALSELVPDDMTLPLGVGTTPLETACRGWSALATLRGAPGPARETPEGLVRLSILDDPFPLTVARALCREVDSLWAAGHLLMVRPEDFGLALEDQTRERDGDATVWLAFADPGTRRLATARQREPERLHLEAARAWEAAPAVEALLLRGVVHRVRARAPDSAAFRRAIRQAMDHASPAEAERWVQLHDLWKPGPDDFFLAFARHHAALELRPSRVRADTLDNLVSLAKTPAEHAQAALLHVIWQARNGDARVAIEHGTGWAGWASVTHPEIAADLMRQVALARLERDEVDEALLECRRALVLAREAAWRTASDASAETTEPRLGEEGPRPAAGAPPRLPPAPRLPRLSRVEVEIATTLSAALLYAGRTREGTRLCEEMAERCARFGLARGQGAFLANLAAGQLFLGQRDQAAVSLARCRQIQPLHGDPLVLAYAAMYQARLAIEGGNRGSGRLLLDEAMTIGQSLGSARITAEIWPLVLEAAVQAADPAEAQRAMSAYEAGGVQSKNDVWPAVLGRWLWLAGDLERALAVVGSSRLGHSGELVAAERGRLLLVSGRYEEARAEGEALIERAGRGEFAELVLFGRLLVGAAAAVPDTAYEPLIQETRASRWVHLYLGALHLDAIRRQLRGENPTPVLRQLRARATDIGHVLYRSLGREEGW